MLTSANKKLRNMNGVMGLSVRQPWAWCILHGKPIENRTWNTNLRGRFFIHAAKGMTKEEYQACWLFVRKYFPELAQSMPSYYNLDRGGIVGEAVLKDCVTESESKWFTGPFGLVLDEVKPLPFQPCKGAQGFFKVKGE